MEPKDVIKIATAKEFTGLMDSLNLSSRQRRIFLLKYSYLLRIVDIAEVLEVSKDTINEDLKCIREKLLQVSQYQEDTDNL